MFQAAVRACNQGGVRNGAATLFYPIFHLEVEDLLVLKNNKGIEDNRVRHLDYGVQFSRLFYQRLIQGGEITLFSPNDVPELYEAFFNDQEKFEELYVKAENNTKIRKKKVKALDLFSTFMQERKDTGRIYLMNVDHANTHSSFDEKTAPVRQSNLCLTGDAMLEVVLFENGPATQVSLRKFVEKWNHENKQHVKVKSYNTDIGQFVWAQVSAAAKTNTVTQLIEITDTDGNTIRCTPEHKIWTKNKEWVCAVDVSINDILVSVHGDTIVKNVVNKTVEPTDVYDITVPETSSFVANNIVVHNCLEITLPTKPLSHIFDEGGRIALCTLSAINWGLIKDPSDFEKPCTLAVRGLDALLSYQNYPVKAAELSTMEHRPLGVGIINFAYWLAKNNLKYTDDSALPMVDQYAEAWSYYLIKASVDLAKEFGPCGKPSDTKYAKGIIPIDTRKRDIDELVPHEERMPWDNLREELKQYGIRNATLMALMPSETSSQLANATNGIEPPRSYISIKQSKDGVLKQVVPEFKKLKNKYELLWDQKSPEGYLKICAVLQKYVDQAISANTSYNPQFYIDEKIPMSEMLKHLLMVYKYGLKTLYYFNTMDGQGEINVQKFVEEEAPENNDDPDCESCVI